MCVWCWLKSESVHVHPPTAHMSNSPLFKIKKSPHPWCKHVSADHTDSLWAASPPQGISLHSLEVEETSPRLLTRGLRLPAQTELANSHSWVLIFSLHPHPLTCISFLFWEDSPSKHWHDAHICPPISSVCLCGRTQCMPRAGLIKQPPTPDMPWQMVWRSVSVNGTGESGWSTGGQKRQHRGWRVVGEELGESGESVRKTVSWVRAPPPGKAETTFKICRTKLD